MRQRWPLRATAPACHRPGPQSPCPRGRGSIQDASPSFIVSDLRRPCAPQWARAEVRQRDRRRPWKGPAIPAYSRASAAADARPDQLRGCLPRRGGSSSAPLPTCTRTRGAEARLALTRHIRHLRRGIPELAGADPAGSVAGLKWGRPAGRHTGLRYPARHLGGSC